MRIEYIDGGFVEIIKNKIVEKVVCNYNGICTVYFNDKDKPPKELNEVVHHIIDHMEYPFLMMGVIGTN